MKKAYIVQKGSYVKDNFYNEFYIENLDPPEKIFLNFGKAVSYCQSIFTRNLNIVSDRPMLKKKVADMNTILYSNVTEGKDYNGDCYFVGEPNENGDYPLTLVEESVKISPEENLKTSYLATIFIIFETFLEE